jgi:hypothetical protein
MRRSLLVTTLGVVMAALLLPSAVLASTAPPAGAAATPATVTTPSIALGCALVIAVPRTATPAIVCKWTAPASVTVKTYRVWRSVDGKPRVLVATVSPDQPLRHADRAIRPGHLYSYRVVAVGTDGSRVGVSKLVSVRYARAAEKLAFNCAYVIDGAMRGVKCNWAASTRPAAIRYVLFRSVDGAARQVVYRTRLNGTRRFLDTGVTAGQKVRYAVVALAADGRIVGVGGPDTVLIPTIVPAVAG